MCHQHYVKLRMDIIMSMFKNIPAKNIITNNNSTFVNEEQLNNINKIPDIENNLNNISTELAQSNISIITEYLLIQDGLVTLTKSPISNKIFFDMYMIVEKIDDITLIHQEIIGGFEINNNTINIGSTIFDGLEVVLSYAYKE